MNELDAARTAKRLGLTDEVICRLQACGHFDRLAFTPRELDARLYRARHRLLGRRARAER